MKRHVRRLPAVKWCVEEHLRDADRAGLGARPATGEYPCEGLAIDAMVEAKARGNPATCIARNRLGEGAIFTLGLTANVYL